MQHWEDFAFQDYADFTDLRDLIIWDLNILGRYQRVDLKYFETYDISLGDVNGYIRLYLPQIILNPKMIKSPKSAKISVT